MTKYILLLVIIAYVLNKLSYTYGAHKVIVKREAPNYLVEPNEIFNVNLIVENKKIFPIGFLKVSEKFPKSFGLIKSNNKDEILDGRHHTTAMTVLPFQRIRRSFNMTAKRRGAYILEEYTVSIGDLLGFNLINKYIEGTEEIIILPERYDLKKNLVSYGSYYGEISVKRWIIEDPIITVGLREYTGREPMKWIHWGSTLKTGELMVKEFDYTMDNRVMVLLNIESIKPSWLGIKEDEIERCISIARTIVEDMEECKVPYGFMNNGQTFKGDERYSFVRPGMGGNHLHSILECLGKINYTLLMTFEDMCKEFCNLGIGFSTIIIITPSIMDEYVEWINLLKNKSEKLVVISTKNGNVDNLNAGIECFVEGSEEN